jgi:hypothetical protein
MGNPSWYGNSSVCRWFTKKKWFLWLCYIPFFGVSWFPYIVFLTWILKTLVTSSPVFQRMFVPQFDCVRQKMIKYEILVSKSHQSVFLGVLARIGLMEHVQ